MFWWLILFFLLLIFYEQIESTFFACLGLYAMLSFDYQYRMEQENRSKMRTLGISNSKKLITKDDIN